jgi:hypothetical protein
MPLRHATRTICIASLLSSSMHLAVGAEITRTAGDQFDVITLQDKIKLEDLETFKNAANASKNAVVILHSPGGNAEAGMEMGRIIHDKNFITMVPINGDCESACAMMWLAGNPRIVAAGGGVGFHSVFIERKTDRSRWVSSEGNALAGAYLHELGLSQKAIVFLTQAPPQGMAYLSESVAGEIGLEVVWLRMDGTSSSAPSSQLPPSTDAPKEPYDPVSAVTQFYRALGNGDGSTAAALIVPEKRGVGNFNEVKMAEFYGRMKEPIRLRSAPRLKGADLVEVEYHYVYDRRVCNGRAEVTTKYFSGNTFIERIKVDPKTNC